MGKPLDGSDLTLKQVKDLLAFFGAPGQVMLIQRQQLVEANLSNNEIDDFVAKGYLEITSSGYLIPGTIDYRAFINKISEKHNSEVIKQMEKEV